MRWEYVPIIGLFVTFPAHRKAVKRYLDPYADGTADATWEAGSKCMTAIVCTFIPAALLIVILVVLQSTGVINIGQS